MSKFNLSFLKDVKLKEVKPKETAKRVSLEKFPVEGADFRIYKNGRMFTAPATALEYSLEFGERKQDVDPEGKVTTTIVGCGLDVFNMKDWQMLEANNELLLVAIVPRSGNSKIDVYGSTSYDADTGEPKRSIESNTVSTYCKEVIVPELASVYGVNWEEVDYVDMVISTENKMQSPTDVYIIPKTVSRGVDKGKSTFVRREFIDVFPLVPFEVEAVENTDPVPTSDSSTTKAKEKTESAETVDLGSLN